MTRPHETAIRRALPRSFDRFSSISIAPGVCVVCLSVLLTLVVAEVFLRFVWPQIYPPHPPGLYMPDASLGYVPTPGFVGTFRAAEFDVTVRTNQAGLRGAALRPLQGHSVRILCLGDSMTWGWGTEDEEAYPAVLERLLQERHPSLDVQVLNAGVAGYGTDEQLALLRSRGADLQPDLVIAQFFPGNDFEDNLLPALGSTEVRDGMLYTLPWARAPDGVTWVHRVDWLKQRSHAVRLISERVGYLAMRAGLLEDLQRSPSEYFSESDAQHAQRLLVDIARGATAIDASTLFVFAPDKRHVLSRPPRPSRAASLVRSAALAVGAPWVDLTADLAGHATFDDVYFVQDGHWTPAGHAVVARVLADRIGDLRLLTSTGRRGDRSVG